MPDLPDKTKQTDGMEDFQEKYAPGEASASEGGTQDWGDNREHIPQKYQEIFRSLCQKVGQRDMFARLEEVKKAAQGRFYWRGQMDVCWNERNSQWQALGSSGAFVGGQGNQDTADEEIHYPFNIYQPFGRGFITIVSQTPSIRMEATKVDAPDALRISSAADAMRTKIEAQNDIDQIMEDVSRLFWTDGRVSFYSRWVTDGARFGYEDNEHPEETPEGIAQGGQPPQKRPRQPKGGELLTPYGVLECKVPINMRSQADFMFRQLSIEIDLTAGKAMYPWIAKKIQAGQPGPGDYNFDRTSRIATTQGIRLLAQAGDTTEQLPTWQRTWFRPSFFAEISDEDRGWFTDNYPDGAFVAFLGDTYCESRNESMDDHWVDCHPLPGDGQSTPSAGDVIIPVQDALCDMTDLAMETFMKAIPAIYGRKDAINFQAIAKQKAGPGAHYPTLDMDPNSKVGDAFWAEPIPQLSEQFPLIYTQLFGDIPQFLTGLSAAAMGSTDPNNETKGGIALLQESSKGQAGVAWRALRKAYAKSMMQLVRIGAYFRSKDADNSVLRMDDVEIDLEDLRDGNWACVPDGDESYPNTHAERKQALVEMLQAAPILPVISKLTESPKNLAIYKDTLGLGDLEIPGADAEEKQMSEIKQLLEEPPLPNEQNVAKFAQVSMVAQGTGQPPPPKPPLEAMMLPSVPIDEEFDDHEAEFTAGKDWINSAEGQQAKRDNKEGFINVRLHLLAHKAAMQKQQAAQMQQAVQQVQATEAAKNAAKPQKTPSESIQFKDLGPSGKLQVGKQAGLDLHADVAADLAGEAMGEGIPQKPTPPNSPGNQPGVQ